MLFFKRTWPIIIAFVMGILMWARFYIPTEQSQFLQDEFTRWDRIIVGTAALLGILSLLRHHWHKIKARKPGFGYSFITLGGISLMAITGLLPLDWHWLGFAERINQLDGPLMYMFQYLMVPMQSTMFSVLAFYIASAAFRAFRARSVEATALLITACIMMIGRVPVGDLMARTTAIDVPWLAGLPWLDHGRISLVNFPYLTDWLLNVPNAASQRGIILGVILAQVAISVRIIFGIERTYMGGGD